MGWKPSEHHGGIQGILESKKFPTSYCIRDKEYVEGIGENVTGWLDKKKKMRAKHIYESGDRVGGARAEVRKPKGTLTFYSKEPTKSPVQQTKE